MNKKIKNFNYTAQYYDLIYKKKKYLKESNFISKFFPLKTKKLKILDLGTGTGNHLINLTLKGHKVDGVELSSNMIELAKKKLKRKKIFKNYKFFNQDVVKFKGKKNKYDVSLSLFHVVNYINDLKSLKNFFHNTSKSLKDSGIFIFDCWNYELVKKNKFKKSKKIIFFNNHKILREGIITLKKNSKVEVNYKFKVYKNNKLIDVIKEKHNLKSFSKEQILNLASKYFKLIRNCVWFEKNKSPSNHHFSSLFIFKKK